MSEYVVMPKLDWVSALDSVRTQTNTSELIKSDELAAIIDGIGANIQTGTVTLADSQSVLSVHVDKMAQNAFIVATQTLDFSTRIIYILSVGGISFGYTERDGKVGSTIDFGNNVFGNYMIFRPSTTASSGFAEGIEYRWFAW